MNWLVASIIALVCWGLWGFFVKLASKYLGWAQIFIISGLVTMLVSTILFFWVKPQIEISSPGFIYSMLAGGSGALAIVAFYNALGTGRSSIVVPLTALYPIVTVIISFLVLSEKISVTKGI